MDRLIQLYSKLAECGTHFFTWDIGAQKAATIESNGQYAIFMDFDNIPTRAEEIVVLAHEGGHIFTGATHKLSSPYDLIEKHENKAWRWAYKKLLPQDELNAALADGYTETWELAEHFDLPEPFVINAIAYYNQGGAPHAPPP